MPLPSSHLCSFTTATPPDVGGKANEKQHSEVGSRTHRPHRMVCGRTATYFGSPKPDLIKGTSVRYLHFDWAHFPSERYRVFLPCFTSPRISLSRLSSCLDLGWTGPRVVIAAPYSSLERFGDSPHIEVVLESSQWKIYAAKSHCSQHHLLHHHPRANQWQFV